MPKWWPFKSKEAAQQENTYQAEQDAFHSHEATLQQELATQIAEGISRQAIMKTWQAQMDALEQAEPTPQVKGQLRAYDLLYGDLRTELGRNLNTGRALEMAGRVDEAIGYYETAVFDQMSTRFPYEHLRIIYRRREQINDALRICQAALQNPFLNKNDHAHFQSWADKLAYQLRGSQ
ncbi:MAG: hypothetical protein H6662_08260 [Ardenticatenaceae bacterium]|nr:hypothetical protein [Anaerolineales bacterium]MCB8921559.1 hypothetical protein [Ardenticatenaceae bacterium]MCB8991476.1 hypothetical protein [Ardenticatenaceae bacterium]MCB9003904.1 hypothetical protein [Ardenticatenaceae bacterium]